MIWNQFVASQMKEALYDLTKITLHCGDFELRAKGRILKFDGFLRVQASVQKKNEGQDLVLPDVKPGEVLNLEKVEPSQHFTKPSPRYTEASLVKELGKRSIGRPSTYATIISTIQDRGYVKNEQRRFFCPKDG